MVKLSGVLDSAHSREDTNILLAQIILRSDYSGSVKNYGDYFSQFQVKSFERNLVRRRRRKRRRKKNKITFRPLSGSKSRNAF